MEIDLALSATIALGVLLGLVGFAVVKAAFYLVFGLPGTDGLISEANRVTEEKLSDIEKALQDLSQVVQDSASNAKLWP